MMVTNDQSSEATDFPATDAAFAFVMPSYQLLTTRFEAADTWITSLLTVTLSLTLGAPVFAKAIRPGLSLDSAPFMAAAALAVACVIAGLVGRIKGNIVLPDPMVMYERSLTRSDQSFKLAQIYYAGENFDRNARAIAIKGNVAIAMTVAICWETLFLIVWLSTSS